MEKFSNPHQHLIVGPNPLAHRIPRVNKDPNFADIGLVLAFEISSGEMIGSAGFHDWPDQNGMIEIGYGIVEQRQREGFGQELLSAMWNEILKNPDVKTLRYTVSPDNAPSIHIINKFGFAKVGEQIDDEDGLELIYEMSVESFQLR